MTSSTTSFPKISSTAFFRSDVEVLVSSTLKLEGDIWHIHVSSDIQIFLPYRGRPFTFLLLFFLSLFRSKVLKLSNIASNTAAVVGLRVIALLDSRHFDWSQGLAKSCTLTFSPFASISRTSICNLFFFGSAVLPFGYSGFTRTCLNIAITLAVISGEGFLMNDLVKA